MASVHGLLLKVFARLPRRGKVAVIHAVSPLYSLGAIVVVRNDAGEILLVRQAYKPRWGLPGGICKRGEEPYDAARREVFEETALRIEIAGEPIADVDVVMRKVDMTYPARISPGASSSDVRANMPEIVECRWFALDDLPELQEEAANGIVKLVAAQPAD
jgi:8-oxo-dGTP diphosphatase